MLRADVLYGSSSMFSVPFLVTSLQRSVRRAVVNTIPGRPNYEEEQTRHLAAYCICPISEIRYSVHSCVVTAHQAGMYAPQHS